MSCGVRILQSLVVGARREHFKSGPGTQDMSNSLQSRLKANHCNHSIDEFTDTIADAMTALCPAWTVDEMLLHPDIAKAVCKETRTRTGCHGVPDDLILRCIIARRKKG